MIRLSAVNNKAVNINYECKIEKVGMAMV